jgi:hypothetical protein
MFDGELGMMLLPHESDLLPHKDDLLHSEGTCLPHEVPGLVCSCGLASQHGILDHGTDDWTTAPLSDYNVEDLSKLLCMSSFCLCLEKMEAAIGSVLEYRLTFEARAFSDDAG